MTGPVVIRFFSPVVEGSINALMQAIDGQMRRGVDEFILLISSPGGSVFHGLSAYNYLKGIPARITTHNFGSVDSIGVVLYCGGGRRLSVPQARFSVHSPMVNFQNASFEEPQLVEKLTQLRMDMENIAKVIAANTNRSEEQVIAAMHDRRTLNPEEAASWGLVDAIETQLYPAGAAVISIQANTVPPGQQPAPTPTAATAATRRPAAQGVGARRVLSARLARHPRRARPAARRHAVL